MNGADNWDIPNPLETCVSCLNTLAPGASVTTFLSFEEGGPVRQDLCEDCVLAGKEAHGDLYWRRSLPEEGERRPVVDYELLREVFGRLRTRTDTNSQRLAYLIGLVLVRKRYLKLRGFRVRDDREVMVVSKGAGQPEWDVAAPYLEAEDMIAARNQLMRLMDADFDDEDLSRLDEDEREAPQERVKTSESETDV